MFLKKEHTNRKRFDCKPHEYDNLSLAGVKISAKTDGGFLITQSDYESMLQAIPENATFEQFRKLRHQLSWLFHTRPDSLATVSTMTQVTQDMYSPSHLSTNNSTIKAILSSAQLGLMQQKLNIDYLRIIVFADSSIANNPDRYTLIG